MSDAVIIIHKGTRRETIISVLVAVAFLFNSLCLLVNIFFPSFSGFGDLLAIAILLVGFVTLLSPSTIIKTRALIFSLVLLIIILISYMYYNYSFVIFSLLQNFIVWGICVSLIMMQHFNLRKTINISFILATVTIFSDLVANAKIEYETMTWTYAIFPCVATAVVHFMCCRLSGWYKLFYIPGLIMLFKFISEANRGGVVSLILLIYMVLIKRINFKTDKMRNKRIVNILLIVLLVCAFVFYEQVVTYLYELFSNWNVEISALKKMYLAIKEGNITNNRTELYEYAWNGFLQSPIWGNGVGGFSVNHGGWAHNFILQILYEGGIMLFALIMMPLIRIIVFFITRNQVTGEEYSLFILLFCTSVPKLLFSTELWNTQGFWMLLTFGMVTIYRYKRKGKEK